MPTAFFNEVAAPHFAQRGGIVYILPDTRALGAVFPGLARTVKSGRVESLIVGAAER
ncbi:MAG: hypothetical protein M3Y55_01245 [Pseudomonadota bacterium]|nr:hypothetical protein [Pseudomonadota bacterium]